MKAPSFEELCTTSTSGLTAYMRRGVRPDQRALSGYEYRGRNTARWLMVAGADRFIKGFSGAYGYNRRIKRSAPDTWLTPGAPEPEPFAFFAVQPVDAEARDNRYLNALLLDYGQHATKRVDPGRTLRDYLVAFDDSHEVLLGQAFIAVGKLRPSPTFFALQRLRRIPPPVPVPVQ